jgi:hypothetical protein
VHVVAGGLLLLKIHSTESLTCPTIHITIENTQYRIVDMPDNSGLDLAKETFPVTVKLDWQLNTTGCPSEFKRIDVTRIKKI